jgi:chromosomal replication initiator protein
MSASTHRWEPALGACFGYNPEFYRRAQRRRSERLKRERAEAEARAAEQERQRREAAARQAAELAEQQARARELALQQMIASRPSAVAVMRHAAHEEGIGLDVVRGPGRAQPIVRKRDAVLVAVVTARPDLSLPRLGRMFNRDHTSILAALRRTGMRKERAT